jgi:hypothetical protein
MEFVIEKFKRVGRKAEGEEVSEYEAKQIKPASVRVDTPENFLEDVLTVCDGDLAKAGPYFESGANHHLRLEAGGYDEWQKAAKKLLTSGLPFVKGWTLEKAVAFLKSQTAA